LLAFQSKALNKINISIKKMHDIISQNNDMPHILLTV